MALCFMHAGQPAYIRVIPKDRRKNRARLLVPGWRNFCGDRGTPDACDRSPGNGHSRLVAVTGQGLSVQRCGHELLLDLDSAELIG